MIFPRNLKLWSLVIADILAKGSIVDNVGMHVLIQSPAHIDQVLKKDSIVIDRTRNSSSQLM